MFGEYGKSAAAFVLKHSKLERKDRQPSVAMGAEIRAESAQEKALHAFLADTRNINLFSGSRRRWPPGRRDGSLAHAGDDQVRHGLLG